MSAVAMPRDQRPAGVCPKCGVEAVQCSYNHFEKDLLTIDSWEHKCLNCGGRETQAFRSDDSQRETGSDPTICPFCARRPALTDFQK